MPQAPKCPICEGAGSPTFIAGEHRMFRCRSCFLAFVDPIPNNEYLDNFYATYHKSLGQGGGYELIESRMDMDFPSKIRLIHSTMGGGSKRILDVGCGKGFFVRACNDHEMQAQGIDLSEAAVAYAKDNLGVEAVCGRLEDLGDSLGTFDAVSFWATVEHLPQPIETLKMMRKVLKPGGHLFLDTGIGYDWLDRMLPGCCQWYDPPQHLFVFSKASMEICLEKAGFRIVKFDPCFERSFTRKCLRIARGLVAASGLRLIAKCTGLKCGPFESTRFPVGNLMSVVARAE